MEWHQWSLWKLWSYTIRKRQNYLKYYLLRLRVLPANKLASSPLCPFNRISPRVSCQQFSLASSSLHCPGCLKLASSGTESADVKRSVTVMCHLSKCQDRNVTALTILFLKEESDSIRRHKLSKPSAVRNVNDVLLGCRSSGLHPSSWRCGVSKRHPPLEVRGGWYCNKLL